MPAGAKARAWFPQRRGPCGGAQVCQCHFLPSALEKTNRLNCLHMLLRGAEGGGAQALPVKENTFKPCCRCSPNDRAAWELPGHQARDTIFHEGQVPKAPPQAGKTQSFSVSLRICFLFWSLKYFNLREKWGEKQPGSWERPNLRNEAQSFTSRKALLWSCFLLRHWE